MLSKKRQQQRISTKKMYRHLLPFTCVQSMNNFNDNIRADGKASLRRYKPRIDGSCAVTARKGFSPSGKLYCNSAKRECQDKARSGPKALNWRNYLRNGHEFWVFLFLSLLLICTTCQADSNQCAVGLNTPGRTWPQGDIFLEDKQSLKIYCILNDTLTDPKFHGKNASDLVFFRHNKQMESEYINVINSTTIMMYVKELGPSEDMYYCRLRTVVDRKKYETVCLNKVVVGFKPQQPRNFSCVSQNWERLNCSWNPVPNYITTRFSLRFIPASRSSRTVFPCPIPKLETTVLSNSCLWDISTNPPYRQVYEYYKFILYGENVLGNESFVLPFHHYAHMIPAKPLDLSVLEKTYSSALLNWTIPYAVRNFPPGLHHRVSYQSQYDRLGTWETIIITTEVHSHEIHFNLTDLKYANAIYDIRVFLKSAISIGEDMWSEFNSITVKTAATVPGQSARTDIGSFEITGNNDKRDVYIYWQKIPTYLENGENFTYQVVAIAENGTRLDIHPSEKNKSYAKFKGIGAKMLKFEVTTTNWKGANTTKATVRVPSHSKIPREPISFTIIAFNKGLYELSWHPPDDSHITNYTIFWCENDRERPFQCTGYLDWIQVHRNETIYTMQVPDPQKIYQFAISANTADASSGMVWASCTAIHNQTVGKMRVVWINSVGSDQIQVGWKLECSDRIDSVKGFVIYYCPISAEPPKNFPCKEPEMNTTVEGGPHTIHGNLSGLKPYTTYRISVAVLTEYGEGERSDGLSSTTLEGATTPPRNLKIVNVTNTTVTFEWEPPFALNGLLRYYTVHYNEHSIIAENTTRFQIQGLEPFKKYNISVSATTVKESQRSASISLQTSIGVPGIMEVPVVRFTNSSQVQITWDPPRNPGGNADYYEIKTGEGLIHTNITQKEKYIAISDCKGIGREKHYLFSVRAVNIGSNNERYVGPWSKSGDGNCYSDGPSGTVWIVIWIIGCLSGLAFLLFLAYSTKRLWIKCKAMRDVEVKLPPGLQSNVKLLEKGNEHHAQQLSVDSSGCSSGQESVTSSLTSDSHVSTDSGADLDPVPMSPTKLLESPPTWESTSSLRQRNVPGTTKPDSSGDRGRWDPYVKAAKTMDTPAGDSLSLARSTPNLTADLTTAPVTPAGSYTMSQQHAWSSTGYISMPSSEEDSSNNPSPLPCGKGSSQGVYSVVGLAPLLTPRGRAAAETRGTERSHPRTADLIPLGTEAGKQAVAANPYVTLASLEQKTRNTSKPYMSSLEDFADMECAHPAGEQQRPPPYSISDKLSKPYVQTGLMDATEAIRPSIEHENSISAKVLSPVAAIAEPSGGRPPFAKNFVDPSVSLPQLLIKLPSNMYVPVDTARGVPSPRITKDSAQVQSPYVAVSTLVSSSDALTLANRRSGERTDDIDSHTKSSNPFSSQLTEMSKPTMQKSMDCDNTLSRAATSAAASLPVVKQTSGYVTIAENPTRSIDNSSLENSSMSYVPHQRVDKKSQSNYQQNVGEADEQYSKVTVVPSKT